MVQCCVFPSPQNAVLNCGQETLLFLSYTLAKKQDVDFTFKDMGCLRFRKNKVKMQFSADFVCSLDSTGRLLKSLLSRSSTRGSAVSGRKDAPSQTASGDIVVFPKIRLCVAPGRAAGEGALQTPKGHVEEKKEEQG
ncbi:coiled-coil domain-containing protein 81-like [Haliaeetus albicilla]|uniref:coiled-coil domain-containing protein 81-like n=1 Tax=Haliaeetus albicilla TaxID=8969 RepID=UPI0037E8DA4D